MPDHNVTDDASAGAFIEHLPLRITINGTEHTR